MIGKQIRHYPLRRIRLVADKILEKLDKARLHFSFLGQGSVNYAKALLDRR